jgi:hypothetical protein
LKATPKVVFLALDEKGIVIFLCISLDFNKAIAYSFLYLVNGSKMFDKKVKTSKNILEFHGNTEYSDKDYAYLFYFCYFRKLLENSTFFGRKFEIVCENVFFSYAIISWRKCAKFPNIAKTIFAFFQLEQFMRKMLAEEKIFS